MAAPRIETLYTAIDVGSSKVAVVIAGAEADGTLHALGTGVREAMGLRLGNVVDLQAVDRCVREALEQAERVAGVEVQQAWVSFGGPSVVSRSVLNEMAHGRGQIEPDDVDELHERARNALPRDERAILHAQPVFYVLDGNAGVREPLGLMADRFGVEVHLVEADRGPVANLISAVRAAHVDVRDVVSTTMAAGIACLTDEQRELGTALIDVGAALTRVGVFAGGMLAGVVTLPTGGADITDAIANQFGTRRGIAERVKCFYGSALSSPRDHQDSIALGEMEGADSEAKITRAELNAVIRARLDRVAPDVGRALRQLGFDDPSERQILLCGGGAELKGLSEYLQGALGGTVRLAKARALGGMPMAHDRLGFATAIGTILYAANPSPDVRPSGGSERRADEGERPWWQRLTAMWQRGA